jgi:hypothetical protein
LGPPYLGKKGGTWQLAPTSLTQLSIPCKSKLSCIIKKSCHAYGQVLHQILNSVVVFPTTCGYQDTSSTSHWPITAPNSWSTTFFSPSGRWPLHRSMTHTNEDTEERVLGVNRAFNAGLALTKFPDIRLAVSPSWSFGVKKRGGSTGTWKAPGTPTRRKSSHPELSPELAHWVCIPNLITELPQKPALGPDPFNGSSTTKGSDFQNSSRLYPWTKHLMFFELQSGCWSRWLLSRVLPPLPVTN